MQVETSIVPNPLLRLINRQPTPQSCRVPDKKIGVKMKLNKWLLPLLTFTLFCCPAIQIEADQADVHREKLLLLMSGEWASRGIYVATKLELADHLKEGSRSVEELAELTQSNTESLHRLLRMLAGLGIFEETSPGIFSNTEASKLLAKNNPNTLHSLSLFYGEDIHTALDELLPAVQTGKTAFQMKFKEPVFSYFKQNPCKAALFHQAMKEKSMAVIHSVLSTYDFSKCTVACDIGGGNGAFMHALLKKNPQLKGSILELPEVVAGLKLQNSEKELNCELIPGDFFVSIPKGCDLYLLKSVLHDWDDAKSETILKNCYEAMSDDSRLLIIEVVLQSNEGSHYANCMDVLMMAITGGKERSLDSFNKILENSGLVLERIYPTSTEFSLMEVRKKTRVR